jgi:hypothetical protein
MMRQAVVIVLSLLSLVLSGCPSPEPVPSSNTSSTRSVPDITDTSVRILSASIIGTHEFGEKAIMAGVAGKIAGENYIFLGTYQEKAQDKLTLRVLSLDEPSIPVEIGSLVLVSPKGMNIVSMALSGTVLMVSTLAELSLVDVSVPETPSLLSQINFDDFGIFGPGVTIGDTVFWNTWTEYVLAVDISDPAQPKYSKFVSNEVGRIIEGSGLFLYGLSVEGLHISDSSLRPSQEIGFYADPTGVEEEVTAGMDSEQREKLEKNRFLWVAAAGNYVYLACGFSGLRVIEVADPSQLEEIAHLDINGTLEWLDVSGSYAYVLNTSRELRNDKDAVEILIVDISTPENPRIAASILLPENWEIYPIVLGDYIYYFSENYMGKDTPTTWTLQIINIHN